jgi:Ca-activated chloride channel family protein
VTKDVMKEFINGRKDDRIGLVVFQSDALALSPPTLDYHALTTMIDTLNSDMLPDGTGIGVGIASALNLLRDSNAASRVVILLTDGEHNAPSIKPVDAAELASAIGVRVYTIGVQSPSRGGSSSGVDEQMLRSIAERTGGQYYGADNPAALATVYKEIGALETSRVGREEFESFTEYGPWLIAAGSVLLLIEIGLRAGWLRRTPS